MTVGRALAILALVSSIGCSVDPDRNPNRCDPSGGCPAGRTCVRPEGLSADERGFCVGGSTMDAGEVDAGAPDAGCLIGEPTSCAECNVACTAPTPMCAPTGGGFECVAACSGSQMSCSGSCADLMTDDRHCGGCDHACDATQMEQCMGGDCICQLDGRACTAAETCCAGRCVVTDTSLQHCGQCGRACMARDTCVAGVCQCESGIISGCQSGNECCDSRCVNTSMDTQNCGSCGAAPCGGGASCRMGLCECPGLVGSDCRGSGMRCMVATGLCVAG
ncbi:MAG: hypothetical protein AB7S26_37015 [Sandaracinaceae bacterium]